MYKIIVMYLLCHVIKKWEVNSTQKPFHMPYFVQDRSKARRVIATALSHS